MSVLGKFTSLGIDVHDQVSVVRAINGLALTNTQKTLMLRQYLGELQKPLDPDARAAARFPV